MYQQNKNGIAGLIIYLVTYFFCLSVSAQNSQINRLFLDVPPDTFITIPDSLVDSLKLPHSFIIPRTEKLYRNNFRLFPGVHYHLSDKTGMINFIHPLKTGDSLTVIYQKYPFPLIVDYRHRELIKIEKVDSLSGEKVSSGIAKSRIWDEFDSFGESLERSGSIVRGIEIGSNRDLTLNSGLNLQLSGYITPQVQVVAALTDESTPIQPEGNTQTLQEVDKVFIKINSPYLGGTLGDFNLSYQNSFFGNLNRKLQGITAAGGYKDFNQRFTYATSRGNFNSNEFLGQEGNQGPYQLVGKSGERDIIILAGTERVYINGQLQYRGENNDYIIDYSLGQITFTNNRLVTGEDRIEIDFEYSNTFQRYGKNFLGISSANKGFGSGLRYDLRFFREWDDTANLLEDSAPLTDEEKDSLASAGNNPLKAYISGADSVGPGNGNYVKLDTLLNGKNYEYFEYKGLGNGDYIVRFSSVGVNQGSYKRERLGVYRFVGAGMGSYLPIRLIPLAGDKKMADVALTYQIGKSFFITGEGALSIFDRNVFSTIDDEENLGGAFTIGTNFLTDNVKFFGKDLGQLNWQLKWKKQQKQFSPLDRQFQPEFSYKWNLPNYLVLNDENSIESNLFYNPSKLINMTVEGGWIERGDSISSKRGRGQISMPDSTFIRGHLSYELVKSSNIVVLKDWQRVAVNFGRFFWKIFPYVDYQFEDKKDSQPDSILTGFLFRSGKVGINFKSILGFNWQLNTRIRRDYLYDPAQYGKRLKLSTSYTHQILATIIQTQKWQGRFSFVFREKLYESFFKSMPADSIPKYQPDPNFQDTSWVDRESHLGRIELNYKNMNRTIDSRWQYRIASELQPLLEKVYVFVGENRGNYRFDEDLQEYVPDPQGDHILIVVPTGDSNSITGIDASWQIRYRPKGINNEYKGLGNIIRSISFFSSIKISEKSRLKDIWQLYLINLEKYHNEETTIRGSYVLDQDLYFFERNPSFGITFRSRFRDNLTNEFIESGFNEKRRTWDRSIIWRQSLWQKKLSQEIEYKQSITERTVTAIPSRNRDIMGHIIDLNLNFRPVYAWQFQLGIEGAIQNDRAERNSIKVGYIDLKPRINYAIAGKARAQTNVSLLNVNILDNPFQKPIPFEMAKGKREGLSLLWNFRFEFFISSNITSTFSFTSRKDAGAPRTIYLGQAEVRAFF